MAIVGGLCLIENEFIKANVLIENGKIVKLTKQECESEYKIDASNCIVIPGFFNAHTHSAMTLLRCVVEDVPLMDWLRKVWSVEKLMNEEDVYLGTKLAIAEMIKSGVTCFSDQYFHMDAVAKAVEETGIRAVLGYGMIDMDDEEKREKELRESIKFVEKWKDKNERITLTIDPHSPYTCSKDLLLKSIELSKKYELPLHIHVSETKEEVKIVKEKTGYTPVKYLESLGFFDNNVIAAHCIWLNDEEIEILAKRRVNVAHCPISNAKLCSGIFRYPEMINKGVNVCLGTDGAASNNTLSILEEMKFAALIQKVHRSMPEFGAEIVFKSATENGYRALKLKGGKIREGYVADLVVLEKSLSYTPLYNPIYSIVYSTYGFEVRDTIVGGKVLMKDRELKNINEEKLIDKVEKRALKLVGRCT